MQVQPSSTSDWPTSAIPLAWVESLFARMSLTYGAKFADQWKNIDPMALKKHWAEALGKYAPAELKRGVDALKTRDWPPTLPEFEKLCRPAVDPTTAYYEAVEGIRAREQGELGTWSHPAVFWAATRLSFDLKHQSYSAVRERWEKLLAMEMEKGQWADIPAPAPALAAPEASRSKEVGARVLADLAAAGFLKPKADQKEWARKILREAQKPGNKMTLLQIRFAKEALANQEAA